jgi:large subunit ribosomal protein L9
MKVLLKKDVDNVGFAGEVHAVSDGFGRNYLLPNGLALLATPGAVKQAESWRKKAETHRAELRAEYELLSSRIREVHLVFKARAGESGKLFGSITTAMIADEMNNVLGTEIDRRKVGLESLRQLGEHKVVVRLSGDFHPELSVMIEDEEETAVPAAPVVETAVAEAVEEPTAETNEL